MKLIDADILIKKCKELSEDEWNQRVAPACWACAYSLTDVDTKECVHHVIFEHSRQTLEDGYNHYWRCWSAKPSEEQWLNTKWDN